MFDKGVLDVLFLLWQSLKQKENKKEKRKESEHLKFKKCTEKKVSRKHSGMQHTHTLAGIPVYGLHKSSKCVEADKKKQIKTAEQKQQSTIQIQFKK